MVNNWDGMDKEKAKEYIVRCQVRDTCNVVLDEYISLLNHKFLFVFGYVCSRMMVALV